jgi:hypothetical protein
MQNHAFIVTKPLQLVIAIIIQRQLDIEEQSTTIIVDAFYDAIGTADRLLNNPSYKGTVIFERDHLAAYITARGQQFNNLYIDTDVGLKKYLQLTLHHRNQNISVYEEGIGTYREDLYGKLRKFALNLIGAGTHFGGCYLTSRIFLFNPTLYKENFPFSKCNVTTINTSLQDFISKNLPFLNELFNESNLRIAHSNSEINLYLTNWEIDKELIENFKNIPGHNFIKPHPHLKSKNLYYPRSITLVSQSIPAELFVVAALYSNNTVNVYHHGSSSQIYLSSRKLRFIPASNLKKKYSPSTHFPRSQ